MGAMMALGADNTRLKADLGKQMEERWAIEAAALGEGAAVEVSEAKLAKARKKQETIGADLEAATAANLEVTRELAARTRSREEALATKMHAAWPAAAVAKIAEGLHSKCYECGDDAKENDGLQQVVRSALADVD